MSNSGENNLLKSITLNTEILHGKPCIRNKRYSVEHVLSYLAGGDTPESLMNEFPDLELADIQACIIYAQRMLANKSAFIAV